MVVLPSKATGALFFALLSLAALVGGGCGNHVTGSVSDPRSPDLAGLTADDNRTTNLLAVGDWSQPVKDPSGYTLRGRLLVFDTPHYTDSIGTNKPTEWWGNLPVFIELQNLSPADAKPVGIYFALVDGFEPELRDARGRPFTNAQIRFFSGSTAPYEQQSWTILPSDGSIRLRIDPSLGGYSPKSSGVTIQFSMSDRWTIPAGTAGFLSGTFSPPTNHPTPPGLHVWQGTLKLPAAKIVATGP